MTIEVYSKIFKCTIRYFIHTSCFYESQQVARFKQKTTDNLSQKWINFVSAKPCQYINTRLGSCYFTFSSKFKALAITHRRLGGRGKTLDTWSLMDLLWCSFLHYRTWDGVVNEIRRLAELMCISVYYMFRHYFYSVRGAYTQ